MAGLQQNDLSAGRDKSCVQPLRQWPSLKPNAAHRQVQIVEIPDQRLWLAGDLHLADDLSCRIDHAHAALFQRDIDSRIMLHSCSSHDAFEAPAHYGI